MGLIVQTGWKPSLRNLQLLDKPEWVPDWVYTTAMSARFQYNTNWEQWVHMVSRDTNCSIAQAEDACIRGIQREINRFKFTYGDKVGCWFEEFLDMKDIFRKVRHPDYIKKLG